MSKRRTSPASAIRAFDATLRIYTPWVGIQPRRTRDCLVVAVDGGVATGKSSLCFAVAQQLRLPYFNAGLLYRALALWCVNEGLARDNADGAVADAADNYPVLVSLDTGSTVITLAGEEVSSRLKTDEISRIVPEVARHAEVRKIMTARQRAVVRKAVSTFEGVVIDGRDATTVVAPDAEVKILLVADQDARAARIGTPEGGDGTP